MGDIYHIVIQIHPLLRGRSISTKNFLGHLDHEIPLHCPGAFPCTGATGSTVAGGNEAVFFHVIV